MKFERNRSLSAVVLEKDRNTQALLWREFLDSFYIENEDGRRALVADEPPLTKDAWDAVVAAGTAWLCRKSGIVTPLWTFGRARCAYPAWSCARDLRELRLLRLLAPPEFLARNVLVSQTFMLRARTPQEWIDPEPLWSVTLAAKLLRTRAKSRT